MPIIPWAMELATSPLKPQPSNQTRRTTGRQISSQRLALAACTCLPRFTRCVCLCRTACRRRASSARLSRSGRRLRRGRADTAAAMQISAWAYIAADTCLRCAGLPPSPAPRDRLHLHLPRPPPCARGAPAFPPPPRPPPPASSAPAALLPPPTPRSPSSAVSSTTSTSPGRSSTPPVSHRPTRRALPLLSRARPLFDDIPPAA
jgi:hypothetical protein